MHPTLWLALASGIAVAAACGLRAFLPLLALGLAGRAHLITLRPGAEWMASDLALLALGVATVVEIAADKIPVVDHVLDVIATGLRPLAAWLAAYAVLSSWPSPWAQIAAVALGTTALTVHALKAKFRLGSTVATLGHANPLLSFAEDLTTLATLAVGILIPAIAIVIPVLLVIVFVRRRRRAPAPPSPARVGSPPVG